MRQGLEGRPGSQEEQEGPEARTEAEAQGRAGSSHTGASTSFSTLSNLNCGLTFELGKGKFFHLKSSR